MKKEDESMYRKNMKPLGITKVQNHCEQLDYLLHTILYPYVPNQRVLSSVLRFKH